MKYLIGSIIKIITTVYFNLLKTVKKNVQVFCFCDFEITIRIFESNKIIGDIEKIIVIFSTLFKTIDEYEIEYYQSYYDLSFKLDDYFWGIFKELLNGTNLNNTSEQSVLKAIVKYKTENNSIYGLTKNTNLFDLVKTHWN